METVSRRTLLHLAGGKRSRAGDLPVQVLRDEKNDTRAQFIWNKTSQSSALGRLLLAKTELELDLLDQIVATAVTRVYLEVKRQKAHTFREDVGSKFFHATSSPYLVLNTDMSMFFLKSRNLSSPLCDDVRIEHMLGDAGAKNHQALVGLLVCTVVSAIT